MSSEPLQSPPAPLDPSAEIARLKRRLTASQEEVQELSSRKTKKLRYANNVFLWFSSLFNY